jgi:5'-methylthioadenosine phosphorylase
MRQRAKIAIIGGTGIYSEGMLENAKKIGMKTPYGKPSSPILMGDYKGGRIAFLFRHGSPKHTIPPHKINFKANMFALKELGVERIIGTAAVGSLQENFERGDFVFPDQFIDFGKEIITYYDGPDVRHVSLADPFCPELRRILIESAKVLKIKFHERGTYLRISGPRFSTRSESRMFRNFADVIGMTCIPEAILSRELGMCYAVIATVTDYDVWSETPVRIEEVLKTMKENSIKIEKLIRDVLPKIPENRSCDCGEAPERGKI